VAKDVKDTGTGTELIVALNLTPVDVVKVETKRNELIAHVEKVVAEHVPDVTTAKGREAIKALAYKVTRTKTAIDDAGKGLNEAARQTINQIDAARRDARDRLDAIAKKARQPLTDWEEAEARRIAECQAIIDGLRRDAVVTINDTADTVKERGARAYELELDKDKFGPALFPLAVQARQQAIDTLLEARRTLKQAEKEKAELAELRAREAERAAEAPPGVGDEGASTFAKMGVEAKAAASDRRGGAGSGAIAKKHGALAEISKYLDEVLGLAPAQCNLVCDALQQGRIPHVRLEV
jgi:colicin import membrane protein